MSVLEASLIAAGNSIMSYIQHQKTFMLNNQKRWSLPSSVSLPLGGRDNANVVHLPLTATVLCIVWMTGHTHYDYGPEASFLHGTHELQHFSCIIYKNNIIHFVLSLQHAMKSTLDEINVL